MKALLTLIMLSSVAINLFAKQATEHTNNKTVTFLQNKGQWPKEILYKATTLYPSVYFLKNGLVFGISREEELPGRSEEYTYLVWNLKFVNSNENKIVNGREGNRSLHSWLSGKDPSKWVIHPEEYKQLVYENIYKNIDLKFYGYSNDLKYDFILKRESELNDVKLSYTGIENLIINIYGELEIKTKWDVQVQKKPIAWQEINGIKTTVEIQYQILNDSTFGFIAPKGFNKDYELIIDPLFQMVWSSYTKALGISNNINYCFGNAMDKNGNVYLTGMVDGTFPVTPGSYSGPGSIVPEVFVAKFSSDGSTMLYSTYLPGNSLEHGIAIAVDDSGRAYVTGVVDLNITGMTNFPTTPNAYQPVHNQASDAFLTVLTPDGSGLVYSTFLGGDGGEGSMGIVLGNYGEAYITGTTGGLGNFPVVNSSAFPTGDNLAFVAKFDVNQSGSSSLIYSAKIGGGAFSSTSGRAIALSVSGNIYLTGNYSISFGSPAFPFSSGAYSTTYNTGMDGYVCYVIKLSSTLPVSIEYATFIGPGQANAITVDNATGEAIITGGTRTFTFPVTAGVMQPIHGQDALGNPNGDIFITRLNAAGSGLIYSTFLGGEFTEGGSGIALNSAGEVYVTGIAQSGFPTSNGAFQPVNAGSYDFILAHINPMATGYACGGSTYVGGSDADYTGSFYDYPAPRISLIDHGGNYDTIAVSATSHSTDFPTTPGVYEPNKLNGIADQPVFFKMTCFITGVPPVANFNSVVNQACNVSSVNFTDVSAGNPTSWQWMFPGANPTSSIQQNPQGVLYSASGTYNVTLIVCNQFGCDTTISTLNITVSQNFSINIGNDTTICNGNSVILSAPPGFANYSWQLNGSNIGGSTSTLNAIQAGAYSVVVSDTLGCSGTDTLIVSVTNIAVSLGVDITICNNDSAQITATPGFNQYQWQLNGNNIAVTTNTIFATQQGTYSVIVTDPSGCTATDSMVVTVNNPVLTLGADIIICDNDSVLINATPGFLQYEWYLNGNLIFDSASSFYASQPGNYSVVVSDATGCTATDEVTVQLVEEPTAAFEYNIGFSCDGIEIRTENQSQNATSFLWILSNGITSTDSNVVFTFNDVQNLTIELIAFNGACTDTSISENISFSIPAFESIPNIITPNNDELNDCFEINGAEKLSDCFSIIIFNRWGSVVYNSINAYKCWEGKNEQGDDLAEGVYYYVIFIKENAINGFVHLVR